MTSVYLRGGLVDLGEGRFERADVLVADGRIEGVGTALRVPVGAEVLDCARLAVVPGMINAHNHSNENWFRGCWDNLPLEPWMIFTFPSLAAPRQSDREIYLRTLLGGLEMVRSGTTTVVDILFELSGFTLDTLRAVVSAYRDLGLRAVIALGMSDRAFYETVILDSDRLPRDIRDRFDRDRPPPWHEWEAFTRSAVAEFHRPEEGISIALAPSGPQRCTDEMLDGCAKLADELDLAIHIHVLETRMQALSAQRMYGQTLPEHLHQLDFLSPRVSFEHGVWLTEHDVELVADSGTSVVHSPVSNMKLGSGISPVPWLLKHGVNVALSTDGMNCNDGTDMYATLKIAALVHKLWDVDYTEWLGADAAWRMATVGGAATTGYGDTLGNISSGRWADLVLLNLDSRVFTPLNNPLRQIVYSSTTSALHSLMVGGRWVVRDGNVKGVDEAEILLEARDRGPDVIGRHGDAFALAERMTPAIRAGWLESLRSDVGVNRSVPYGH